jgi:hypothetical protein
MDYFLLESWALWSSLQEMPNIRLKAILKFLRKEGGKIKKK